jgi:putrescine aminotransferase
MLAIDLVQDKTTRTPIDPANGFAYRLAEATRKHGAIVRPVGTKLIVSPPLVITDAELDRLTRALLSAFEELA